MKKAFPVKIKQNKPQKRISKFISTLQTARDLMCQKHQEAIRLRQLFFAFYDNDNTINFSVLKHSNRFTRDLFFELVRLNDAKNFDAVLLNEIISELRLLE
jgi:hypothetical protein